MSEALPTPPLLQFFWRLRQADFPLGLDDYTALRRLIDRHLVAHDSLGDRDSLFRLICLLWAKSQEDVALLKREFEPFIAAYLAGGPREPDPPPPPPEFHPPEKLDGMQTLWPAPAPAQTTSTALPAVLPPPATDVAPGDPLILARKATLRDNTLSATRLQLQTDYFPITIRQMQQSWRHIRRSIREGPKTELDIEATVQKIGQEGMLSAPVLVPKRVNRAEVMLLIDCDGSMVPFHLLTRQLSETALRGSGLYASGIFYFHDYADRYVYLDRARLQPRKLKDLMAGHDPRCPILIVSDAGAARGRREPGRLTSTQAFIKALEISRARLAWLNPMPAARWRGTTAGDIARLIPMFQMNRDGLDAAIRVLRGHAVATGMQQAEHEHHAGFN